jgi:polysaccharide chain length determinant protein (PEP-CTERM system associated)
MQEVIQQVLAVLRGMWKFRWPGLVVAWAVAFVGVVVIWRIPNQYEAAARIYVDTDSILKPLMSGLAVQPNIDQQISMLSRTLVSRPNIEKLIRMADLDLKSQTKDEQEALVEKLLKNIEIRGAGGVNLYSLAYRDKEQDKAKRVIQSMVSIFVESGLGASRKDTDSAKTFLSEQIKTYESKLEEAEARMKDFRLRNIDRQSADGKDSASRLGEIWSQLEAAKLQLREAEKSRDAAKRQLAELRGEVKPTGALPDLLAGRSGSSSGPATFATPEIDGRINEQKRNLDGLLQRYTDQHPDVQSARRLIADLEDQKRKEVAELQKRAASQPAAAAGPNAATESLAAQELNRMVATAEVQAAAIQARVDEYSSRYAAVKETLKSSPQLEAEAAQLNRDYAITKKNYEDLVARRQSAVMSGELDVASGVADFRLIDPPRVSPKPVAPNRPLLVAGALLAALASGLGLTFVASQVRPTFSSAEELRQLTGLPLLGVVSRLVTEGDLQRERTSLYRFVAASGGLVGLFVAGLIALTLMSR